ncbi:Nn.00g002080.m01.CDS01 [Neocucurbitaria sp. VM-36]
MSWTLLAPPLAGDTSPKPFPLTNNRNAHIVLTTGSNRVGIVSQFLPELQTELGRVTVGLWGAKLEAIDDTLSILSAQQLANPNAAAAVDPRTEKYVLESRLGQTSEVILLRHGDWTASEVQVNSSAADPTIAESAEVNGINETPEEVTEDEDLDNTVVAGSISQQMSPQRQPTPQLSNQRSVVVQETPTVDRYNDMTKYAAADHGERNASEPSENTPSPENLDQGETELEPFSTARTGDSQKHLSELVAMSEEELPVHAGASVTTPTNVSAPGVDHTSDEVSARKNMSSPRVEIPTRMSRKRSNSATEHESETDTAPVGRSSKRKKNTASSDDDTEDSRLSNIVVETSRKTAAKGKKRLSEVPEATEASTPKSQRSSQRSSTITTAETYDGLTPRVAFSHSAIAPSSQALKFLKKHKGVVVESIDETCNVLCVRPGTLTKTMKLLQSVALGIPIVTDNWLLDSAKAGHLLSLSKYQPSVPKQEEEWKFTLDKVWGKPQAPFEGYNIHFTAELRKSYANFKEIEQVCKTVGAKLVTKKPDKSEMLVVLAKEDKDKEADKLMQDGIACYTKDLLTNSILRGEVDLESHEFMINAGAGESAAAVADTVNHSKKKRGRKS